MPKVDTRRTKTVTTQQPTPAPEPTSQTPNPVPVPEPAPVVIPETPNPVSSSEAPAGEQPQKTPKTPVEPLIATARVKNAVNDDLLNNAGNALAESFKVQLSAFPENDDSAEKQALEAKKVALSKCKVRFSNKSSTYLAGACTVLARSLISTALSQAKTHDVKTVNVKHLYSAGLRGHEMYPLIVGLPSFENQLREYELQESQKCLDKHIKNAVTRAEKEFCKKYNVKKTPGESDKSSKTESKGEPKQTATSTQEPDDDNVSFVYYVVAICVSEKDDPSMRTSKKFQKHISDIILEFAQRTIIHASRLTTHMNNKTINEEAVLESIISKYIENVPFKDTFEFKQVPSGEFAPDHTIAVKHTEYVGRDVGKLQSSILAAVAEYKQKPKPTQD